MKQTTREEAEAAVGVLIGWTGDNPERSGLLETPARVARAFDEWFAGYAVDPLALLHKGFADGDEVKGANLDDYDGFISLRRYGFISTCEHHLARIIGVADVIYLPREEYIKHDGPRIVGLSKLGRLVDCFARRLQVQERLTTQICDALQTVLNPAGIAVRISAEHQCMTSRGVHRPGCWTDTQILTGAFRFDPAVHNEITALLGSPSRPR